MNPLAPFDCPKTDAVLALHLDGDLDAADDTHGYAFADAPSLHEHLRECAACQRTLRRARRLDATLAHSTGTQLWAHAQRPGSSLAVMQDRWFAAVAAAAAPPPAALPRTAPRTRPLLAAATAALALLALTQLLPHGAGGTVPACIGTVLPPAPTTASAPVLSPAPFRPAANTVEWLRTRRTPASAGSATGEPAEVAAFAARPAAAVACIGDGQRAIPERRQAATALLARCADGSEEALRQLLAAFAACGDASTPTPLHREHLDRLLQNRGARSALLLLLQQLDRPLAPLADADSAAILVAARAGSPELDAALGRLARRHDGVAELVATALRCGVRPRGAARLLLDLWQEQGARSALASEEQFAQRLFGGQRPAVFAELANELGATRATPRRVRCLLGLGAADDDGTVPVLERVARSHNREEAVVAAFALSCLPRSARDHLEPRATEDAFWLRAALRVRATSIAGFAAAALDRAPPAE